MRNLLAMLKQIKRYPSAIVGVSIIGLLIGVSVYTVIAIPYSEAIRLWRGGPAVTRDNPQLAAPRWYDLFTRDRLSRTIVVRGAEDGIETVEPLDDGMVRMKLVLPFEYRYDTPPSEISLFTAIGGMDDPRTRYSVEWRSPDGTEVSVVERRSIRASDTYRISQDGSLRMELGMVRPEVGLLGDRELLPGPEGRKPVKGQYEAVIVTELPEGAEFKADLVLYGEVFGLAGTDHRRRDIMVALLWGTPLALVFGLLGAVGANISTFVLAGISTWFGGKVDALFQRITEVNMILPILPILVMIGQFYSRSLWVMLGLIIALNVFSAGMKLYRAMFIQAKESPYIEAAQAYGAGNFRIIFRYLLPRIVPVLLPQFVLVIPTFVFLEATLAVIGLGDPILPTWGKVIYDARVGDALYKEFYYWMVQPAVLLMVTGFGFALVGYTLDRIFNPRLRSV
ncbi:MAG: ABC transporter permease [Candidatus Bipolaricaulota bacterium]